jgi:hypothetical protein
MKRERQMKENGRKRRCLLNRQVVTMRSSFSDFCLVRYLENLPVGPSACVASLMQIRLLAVKKFLNAYTKGRLNNFSVVLFVHCATPHTSCVTHMEFRNPKLKISLVTVV